MAFASRSDLETRLGRTFTGAAQAQVDALLDDATEALRDAIGWQVYPAATLTLTMRVEGGQTIDLPPATSSVASILIQTDPPIAAVDYGSWSVVDGSVRRELGWPFGTATIVATVGYAAVPPPLARWCRVLAAQGLAAIERRGTLGGDGTVSIAIDDYRQSWDPGAVTGDAMAIPDKVAERLRTLYGLGGVYVTASRA